MLSCHFLKTFSVKVNLAKMDSLKIVTNYLFHQVLSIHAWLH